MSPQASTQQQAGTTKSQNPVDLRNLRPNDVKQQQRGQTIQDIDAALNWTKLEKGDIDWAHQAMNYWPERVREKCKTDKSLAIAHGLEDLYIEPEAKPKKARGKKKSGDEV